MTLFYAFNGDADGLCALQQLRLAHPQDATLVTGVKRDIKLLRHLDATIGDRVTVLDVSLDQNREDLLRLLEAGASVRYFDHHRAGEMPQHPNFEPHIEEEGSMGAARDRGTGQRPGAGATRLRHCRALAQWFGGLYGERARPAA
jgi:hypothetical protein